MEKLRPTIPHDADLTVNGVRPTVLSEHWLSTISRCYHAHEDTILTNKMMVERRADMRGRKAGDGDPDQAVN